MAEHKSEEPKAAPPEESLTKKLLYGLGGVVLVPLIGALIGAYFQQRTWSNENRNARVNADMQSALTIGSNVATLTNERYSALLQLADLVDHQSVGRESWDAANQRALAANKAWEVSFTNDMSQLKFYVDSPFGVEMDHAMQQAAREDCTKLEEGRKLDMTWSRSAEFLFATLNNCYGQVKSAIDQAIASPEAPKADARRAHVLNARAGLSHVWHVNAILGCQIDGRVLKIRKGLDQLSFFKSLVGADGPSHYQRPEKESDCLAQYRN
ncbi:MAG TPA: hypothetical protein VMJ31_01550 [Methylocystis sp.]|nr:hypothetical protein [Methylocystis sp.]